MQIPLKYTKLSKDGEKLAFNSYGFIISSSDNPVDFHEEILFQNFKIFSIFNKQPVFSKCFKYYIIL